MKKIKKRVFQKAIVKHMGRYGRVYASLAFLTAIVAAPVVLLKVETELFGDWLGYIGTTFGLFFTVVTYLAQKHHEEKVQEELLQPNIRIEMETLDKEEKAYLLTISNRGEKDLAEIWIEGENTGLHLDAKSKIQLNVDGNDQNENWFGFQNENRTIFLPVGNNAYPKNVGICCTDETNRVWSVEFTGSEGTCGLAYRKTDVYIL